VWIERLCTCCVGRLFRACESNTGTGKSWADSSRTSETTVSWVDSRPVPLLKTGVRGRAGQVEFSSRRSHLLILGLGYWLGKIHRTGCSDLMTIVQIVILAKGSVVTYLWRFEAPMSVVGGLCGAEGMWI